MIYDELIKRLRECTAEMNGEKTLWHQAADAIEDLQASVDGLTAQTIMVFEKTEGRTIIKFEPKWIPVTERLPQKADTYLVFVANVFQKSMTATTTALWGGQNFIVGDFVAVTHWMPIPQPPEDGET